jgi:hypothetical protein
MPCYKYIITNACGHKGRDDYIHCGADHPDDLTSNSKCYESSDDRRFNLKRMSVCMGRSYCDEACAAAALGWYCCTCNYERVTGFVNPQTGIPMHSCENGLLHALCSECRGMNEPSDAVRNLEKLLDELETDINDMGDAEDDETLWRKSTSKHSSIGRGLLSSSLKTIRADNGTMQESQRSFAPTARPGFWNRVRSRS